MGTVEFSVKNCGTKSFILQEVHYSLSGAELLTKSVEEHLSSNQEKTILLDRMIPQSAGSHVLLIQVVIRWREDSFGYIQEELFIYQGETILSVLPSENKAIHISQVQDARIIISAPDYGFSSKPAASHSSSPLLLNRNRIKELKVYSYPKGYTASRKTKIYFPDGESGEMQEFSFQKRNRLGFGRALPSKDKRVDASLRIYPLEGENLTITKTISSHHFDLTLMSGKLYIVDVSSFGTSLNGKPLPKGLPVRLDENNTIAPFTRPDYITKKRYQLQFQISGEIVIAVHLKEWKG